MEIPSEIGSMEIPSVELNGQRSVEATDSENRLRALAIVGLGYWGPNWVRNLCQSRAAKRLICCDLSLERRRRIQQLYPNVELTADLNDVLSDRDIEGVVVATPVNTHYEIARQCLNVGKSVLVEKPLATSQAEGAWLVGLAREHGKVLMVGHTFEYSAPVLKTRAVIESGELGEILYISSIRANLGLFQHHVNVVWDLATHDISIILMLLGQMPERVSCHGSSHYRTGEEDVALLALYFPNNVMAYVHVSWLDPNKIRRMTVIGSRKMLVYDDTATQEKIRIYDKGVNVSRYYDTYGEFQFSYRYGDINIPRIEENEPLKIECDHFVECIKSGATPNTDGINGLRVVSVLEAANKSLRSGGQTWPIDKIVGW
jgi:predicted dehydrogenase